MNRTRRIDFRWLLGILFAVSLLLPGAALSQQNSPAAAGAARQELQPAQNLVEAGKYQDAIKQFRAINKQRNNTCFDCYLGAADARIRMGDYRGATQEIDKGLPFAPDADSRAMAHSYKGNALRLLGGKEDLKQAEAEYRIALKEKPAFPACHFVLGLTLMKQNRDEEGIAELKTAVAQAPQHPIAERAKLLIANPRRAREDYAPSFRLTTLQGEAITLEKLAGKTVVLDFWATWCAPCRESLPELRDLLKANPPERLVLISISADDDESKWREFIASKKMTWAQYRDADKKIRQAFSVNSYPTYLILNGEGIIKERISGTDPQQSVAFRLKPALASLFKDNNQAKGK